VAGPFRRKLATITGFSTLRSSYRIWMTLLRDTAPTMSHSDPTCPSCCQAGTRQRRASRHFIFVTPTHTISRYFHFPDGKGDPKWHAISGSSPFLGIDHSAIVVSNTEASIDYYCRQLGLHIAGTSENYGAEQEHLNNVFGARLRITSLRAARGPGIELLQYLLPATGRPIPADTRANDIWHWLIYMSGNATKGQRLGSTSAPAVTKVRERGAIMLDPDRRAVLLHIEWTAFRFWRPTPCTTRLRERSSQRR
jgi:catechol 2,3-dioxygenase-like lactoylglutathione lyase family enzyme